MPKKIKAYLTYEDLKNSCENINEFCWYMRGWLNKLVFDYKNMKMSEIKRNIEDLKVAFEFLDKRGYEK